MMAEANVPRTLTSTHNSGRTGQQPWSKRIRTQTEEFFKELLPFGLHGLDGSGITQARLQSVRTRLIGEREEPREQNPMGEQEESEKRTPTEDVRDANLIASASLLLEDYETAKAETESALEKDPDNMIANANLAVLLWKQGSKAKAEKQLSVWRRIQDEELEIRGKAELAYCFGRLGPEFTDKAVRLYEEVVGQKPNEYNWKFGLAMNLSRQTRANIRMCHGVRSNEVLQKAQAAVEILQDIKMNASSNKLRGRAAADLGFLVGTADRRLAKHLKDNYRDLKAQQCFEEAYEWAPDDVCVLNNYGRFLKFTGKLEEAKKLLLTSVKQRPTGTAHDLLGLVYQRLAEERKRKEMRGPQKQTRHNKGKNKNKKQNRREQKDLTASNVTKGSVSLSSEHGSVSPTLLLKDCSLENKNEAQTKTSRTRQSRNRKSRLVDQDKQKHLIQNETEAPKHDESQVGSPRKNSSEQGSVSPKLLLTDCSLENKKEAQTRTRRLRNRKSRLVDQDKTEDTHNNLTQNETETPKHVESQIGRQKKRHKLDQTVARGREAENGAGRSDLKLDADDEDIKQAILHFEEAVKLSNDENTTSLYHLQNLLKLIGDMDGALTCCERIVGQDKSVFSPRNNISALEKAGLIELQISTEKEDETERRQHQQQGKELLYQALEIQHALLERDHTLKSMFIKSHESFRTLLEMNEQDTCISELERLKENARLWYKMFEADQTLKFLDKIDEISATGQPDEVDLPEMMNMRLQCYARKREYEKAVSLLDKCKEENIECCTSNVPVLSFCLAARDRMLSKEDELDPHYCFRRAFEDVFGDQHSNKAAENCRSRDAENWDVTILHDPDDDDGLELKASKVKAILKDVCGLKVTCMADDVWPGRPECGETLKHAEKCRLLMIVLGDYPLSEEFRDIYLEPCLLPPTQEGIVSPKKVVVQTQRGTELPRRLMSYTCCDFPSVLLEGGFGGGTEVAESHLSSHNHPGFDGHSDQVSPAMLEISTARANAACKFFCHILGVFNFDRFFSARGTETTVPAAEATGAAAAVVSRPVVGGAISEDDDDDENEGEEEEEKEEEEDEEGEGFA